MPLITKDDGTVVFRINVSSLPRFADCELAWFVNQDDLLKSQCEKERKQSPLPPKPQHIGANFGTSAHAGVEQMLNDKIETGAYSLRKGIDAAIAKYRGIVKEIKEKELTRKFDDFTKNDDAAEEQLARVLQETAAAYVVTAEPVIVEPHFTHRWARDYEVSGHPDVILTRWLDDFKYGARTQAHQAQGGGYLWLAEKEGYHNLEGFRVNHIKRTGLRNAQSVMRQYRFDPGVCKTLAFIQINRIVRQVDTWYEKPHLRQGLFNPNPNSKLCHKTTCTAFGTSACDAWIPDLGKENETSGY